MSSIIVLLFVIIILFTIFYMFYLLYIEIKLCIAEFHEFTIKPIINNTIINFIIKRIIKPIIYAPGIKIITNLIFYIFYPIISIMQNSKQIIDNERNKIQKKEYKKQQKEEKQNLKKLKKNQQELKIRQELMLQEQRKLEAKEKKIMQKLRIEYLKKCVFIDPQIKIYLDELIGNIAPYERDNIKNYLIPYLTSRGNIVLVSKAEISKNKIKENAIINNGPFGLAVCKKIN